MSRPWPDSGLFLRDCKTIGGDWLPTVENCGKSSSEPVRLFLDVALSIESAGSSVGMTGLSIDRTGLSIDRAGLLKHDAACRVP
jgi:hypothetical protein